MSEGFFRAIRSGHLRQVACLVRSGVSPRRARDLATGQCALVVALHLTEPRQRLRMFRYLYNHGADTGAQDQQTGRDVFTWSCFLDRTTEAMLVMADCTGELDFQHRDSAGRTGLHYAAVNGNATLLQAMLEYMRKYDIGVDVRDAEGFTPYLLARRLGHKQCADILARAGASPKQLDGKNFRSVDDWVWIGEREKSYFARESNKNEIATYKVLGRLPALQAANFQPRNINIVPSKLDRDFLSKKETPDSSKSSELFKQKTWLDFDRIKAKRLTKSLPNFHLPPLDESSVGTSATPVNNSLTSSATHVNNSLTSSSSSSLRSSPSSSHRATPFAASSQRTTPTASGHAPSTRYRPVHARDIDYPQHNSTTAEQHTSPVATMHHHPPSVHAPSKPGADMLSGSRWPDESLTDIMRVLEEQCAHSYRPFVRKKVIVPTITVQKPGKKQDGKQKANKLKNQVLAKQMAKKLMGKKDKRTTSSRASKISTISEES